MEGIEDQPTKPSASNFGETNIAIWWCGTLFLVTCSHFTEGGKILFCRRNKEVEHLLPLVFLQIAEILPLADAAGHFIIEPFPFHLAQLRFNFVFVAEEEIEYPLVCLGTKR